MAIYACPAGVDMTQEALKLALEALENHTAIKHPQQIYYRDKAITAIKEALAQTQEPVAYLTRRKIGGTEGLLRADMVDKSAKNQETHDFIPLYTAPPQQEQEPVAWVAPTTLHCLKIGLESVHLVYETEMVNSLPLYDKPQRTWVGLTDDEISELSKGHIVRSTYARAIEAKLKELNT
jgi:hypothetical protein